MASAAFTAVCTQAATSFLSHGDLAQTGKDLLSSQGIRALGTAVATAGLIGDGGSMAELSFGQRLAVNGFRSMVRAGVSSAIEKRNIGDCLKDAGMSAVVDSISGALAKSIGEAAADKGNPLTYGEHKAAHFGVGFLAGGILDKDHPLTGAVTGGLGAMMGEVVAESLVDRPQIEREVLHEMKQSGEPFSIKAYNAAYREKLQPYINTARLVVGSTIAAMGHNPSIAIAAATNALENNFTKSIPLPNWSSFVCIGGGMSGFAAYTTLSLSLLYREVGLEGMFFKLVEDGIIKVQKTNTGETVYQIHVELFATPEAAWNMIERELPFCQTIKESEWVKGRTLGDTFTSASFTEKLEAVAGLQEVGKQSHKMDAVPEGARWKDEGFAAAEQRPTIISTPIPDYEIPNEGFMPWEFGTPTYSTPISDDLPDTSILEATIYMTYTKMNEKTKQVYSGRTRGEGELDNDRDHERILNMRDRNHHMDKLGYLPALVDKVSLNPEPIRGREQILVDQNGGAQSKGGTSGNRINGISDKNPKKDFYQDAANKEFGS